MIESALQPSHFIAWNQENAFVADLEGTEREIAAMVANDPQRASKIAENKRINRAATLEIAGRRFSGQSVCRGTASMNI
jgi:hypothetical protein